MRNPLNRRLPRELKSESGKYIVIFIFVCGMIAIVSGFLVANDSMVTAYDEGFTKYNIEDGNFELGAKADDKLIEELEKQNLTIYENFYKEEKTGGFDSTLRIFINREKINRVCLMDGRFPESENEIAIDRMYADNNKLTTGEEIELGSKTLKISGLVALSDYSALYSSPSDLMFDASKFGVSVMTREGYDSINDKNLHYSYSFKYDNPPGDDEEAKKMSDDFIDVLSEKAIESMNYVTNYIPEYSNQAIIFTGDDLKGDNMAFTVFLYLVIAIIAFIFAIMTSNTITKEANVIGTLRASGYSRGELVRHYLTMPMIVVLIAAAVGNVLGYTCLKDYMADAYYGSYSLPTYVTLWNADAFIKTTAGPLILMFIINLAVLEDKLRLSPLKFIRRDLARKTKKKALHLNTKIPILHRFRIRVIFQNIPNYITIFTGVLLANVILLFGLGLDPLLTHYEHDITSNMICDYQYLLKAGQETKTDGAEKFCAGALDTVDIKHKSETASVYGIAADSRYIDIDFKDGVYITNAYSEKFGLHKGDTLKVKEKYSHDEYSFVIDGVYYYPSSIAIFMDQDKFNETFDNEDGYFNGYFTDNEITDIEDVYIASKITQDDFTKVSRQLEISMGNMMTLFVGFGVIMFVLIIYLLSKIIIEKNAQSISMTKILGYKASEIGGLYVLSTALVVAASLLITIPVCNVLMDKLITVAMSGYSGWLPYYVPFSVFVKMAALGLGSYAVVAALQYIKIGHISKSDALKNAE
ncbi:MAG: ABC transporter permease [Oscillospiraceae bacterium]|nr:ABC transporter permease [Oscillospiraceae bacterium]